MSKVNLSNRAMLKLAQLMLSVVGSASAMEAAKDLPEEQKKAIENIYTTYDYAFKQIQEVVFPFDFPEEKVEEGLKQLAEIVDQSEVAQAAVEKVKEEILKATKN